MLTGLGDQTESTRGQLRTEAKYRYEFIHNTPNVPNYPGDVILGVGLQLMFGAPTFSQYVFQGAILIVAVGLSSLGRMLAES